MRLQNYLQDKYIGIKEKTESNTEEYSDKINILLKKLNIILERNHNTKKYVFDIVSDDEFKSPSEIIKPSSRKKFENVIKEWMLANEKLEVLKESLHKDE